MKFRLLKDDGRGNRVGRHYAGNRFFSPGEIIESDSDLVKLFRNKFERVDDAFPASEGAIDETIEAVMPVDKGGAEGLTSPPTPSDVQPMREPVIDEPESEPEIEKPAPAKTVTRKKRRGLNVTDEFPDADLANLFVYHNADEGVYRIIDKKAKTTIRRFKKRDSVEKFLHDQLG
jgi:hypothetical protein